MPTKPGARKISNTAMRRPAPVSVGATPIQPLQQAQAPARKRAPKRPKPGLGIAEDATLTAPIPRHTVSVGRQYRAPDRETQAMIGGAPPDTKPSSQIASPLAAQLGIAQRVGARPRG